MTRRRLVQTVSAAAAVGLAGCGEPGGDGGADETETEGDVGEETETETEVLDETDTEEDLVAENESTIDEGNETLGEENETTGNETLGEENETMAGNETTTEEV